MRKTNALATLVVIALVALATAVLPPKESRAFSTYRETEDPVHAWITEEGLWFVRPNVESVIEDAHRFQDLWEWAGGNLNNDPVHFSGCLFDDSARYINTEYARIVDALSQPRPDLYTAADKFGMLLHPVQDFYAHSNWVEIWDMVYPGALLHIVYDTVYDGRDSDPSHPVEDYFWPTLGDWAVMDDYHIVIGQASDGVLPTGWSYESWNRNADDASSRVPFVTTSNGDRYAVLETAGSRRRCDPAIVIEHGDPDTSPTEPMGTYLKKDKSEFPFYDQAKSAAVTQTTHEWCRLLYLSREDGAQDGYGLDGVSAAVGLFPKDDAELPSCDFAPDPPTPLDVTVSVTYLHAPVNRLWFSHSAYTTDLRDFAQDQSGGVLPDLDGVFDAEEIFEPLTMCVSPSDSLAVSLQAHATELPEWNFFPTARGVTVELTGPGFAGTYEASSSDLDAVFRVETGGVDSDSDGLSDGCGESAYGTDPLNPDTDGDGLNDGAEVGTYGTDPNNADSDADGLNDGLEVQTGLDPLDADTDGDGLLDGEDVDFIGQVIGDLRLGDYKPPGAGTKKAMLAVLADTELLLDASDTSGAIAKLVNLRKRLDGCGTVPDRNDWIITCPRQLGVRVLLDLLIENLRT